MSATMDINQAQAWGILIAAIVGAVGSLAAALVSVIVALRQSRTETKVDAQAVKQDAQAVKQDAQIEVNKEIHLATNGALAVAKEALQIANSRVTQLEESIQKSGEVVPLETKQTEQKPVVLPPSILLHQLDEATPPTPEAPEKAEQYPLLKPKSP